MNKRWILSLIFIIIVAAVFYWLGTHSGMNYDLNSQNKMSATELLSNKIKCEGYLEKAKEQANSNSYSLEIDAVYKVFYSESLDTCLSEEYNLYPAHQGIAESELLLINDVLTGGNIWTSETYSPELKYWDAQTALDQEANKYQ